jgi:hypothetical protein
MGVERPQWVREQGVGSSGVCCLPQLGNNGEKLGVLNHLHSPGRVEDVDYTPCTISGGQSPEIASSAL